MQGKKIMLVLAKDMGDVMLANSLARDIKDYYGEDTEISLYVNEQYTELVSQNPDITHLYRAENWLKVWDEILGYVLHSGYDKVMIPQQIRQEDTIWHQLDYLRHNHMLQYYQLRCGLPKRKTELIFYPNPKAERPLMQNRDIVVIHCQTRNPDKDWPYFPQLIKIMQDLGYHVYQVGGKGDKPLVNESHNLLGKYSFSELWHLIQASQAFIGLDSGLSFIAATTGTQCFTLYGSSIPETSGAYGENVTHIVSPACDTCKPIRCHGHCQTRPNCVSRLTVSKVWEKVGQYLDSKRKRVEKKPELVTTT